jgi:molybdopterin synthase sulfur carrier subunit
MATVFIPALLRDLTQGQESMTVPGATVGEVVEAMEQIIPGIKERLCTDASLRPGIAVVVDNQISRQGMHQPVEANSEIHFLPSISGGQQV